MTKYLLLNNLEREEGCSFEQHGQHGDIIGQVVKLL
jgi:hypothetical protein